MALLQHEKEQLEVEKANLQKECEKEKETCAQLRRENQVRQKGAKGGGVKEKETFNRGFSLDLICACSQNPTNLLNEIICFDMIFVKAQLELVVNVAAHTRKLYLAIL